ISIGVFSDLNVLNFTRKRGCNPYQTKVLALALFIVPLLNIPESEQLLAIQILKDRKVRYLSTNESSYL
ncbi:hypothetical protein, partial [Pantanalinema sp. GBBB05]|uniref:hypothetical protein n=1 Tax=Pantanalinema sp. GBBB05 TaxID=2604139 RepID=UPI003D81C2B3